MEKLFLISYMLLFIGLLCCSVSKQEVDNGEQLMQVKEEPIKPYGTFNYFSIIDVPKKPCPKNQRRDIFGNCRPIFNFMATQVEEDDDQLKQELLKPNDISNFLHIIEVPIKKPCVDNQKKDIFEECRPLSNIEIKQEMDNVEPDKQEPIKPNVSDETIRPCAENQRRDIFGNCRPISNYDTKQEVDNDEQLMEDKVEPIKPRDDFKFLPIIDVPLKPCPPNQKRDIFGRCRPKINFVTNQEENHDDQLDQDKQDSTNPYDDFTILHIIDVPIRPCPQNQKRDLRGECRPISKYKINQKMENDEEKVEVNEEPIKRRNFFNLFHIINVPIKSCPEDQKRDMFGICRPGF